MEDKLIILKKTGILKRDLSEIYFKDIKELKIIKKGILQNFFDYGDIILDTNIGKITISNVSDIVISSQNFIKLIKN